MAIDKPNYPRRRRSDRPSYLLAKGAVLLGGLVVIHWAFQGKVEPEEVAVFGTFAGLLRWLFPR